MRRFISGYEEQSDPVDLKIQSPPLVLQTVRPESSDPVPEGKYSHVLLRIYAPLHGSWEARISRPSHAYPPAPRAKESGVSTRLYEQRLALWE
jgi:hypothetical protein